MAITIYRCDDHYFKTTHQGEKPQQEMLQKVESMGGGNCDKDERWAIEV